MPLAFLAPLFLLGLAAIALPVIVHLTHRQRKEIERFPSLTFLASVPFRSVQRQRIRDPLLFTLRCLALGLLAFAFARPFLDRGAGAAAAGGRELVILLDRSYSMGLGDRWRRAVDTVRSTLGSLGPDDHAALVLFDETAEVVAPFEAGTRGALAELGRAEPGFRSTRYAAALQAAHQLLANRGGAAQEVLLVTDLQRHGWDRDEALSLPDGATLRVADLSRPLAHNLAVAGVAVARSAGPRDQVTVSARLANTGSRRAERVEAVLEVAGRVVGRRTLAVDSGAAATVVFDPLPSPPGPTAASVRIGGDALAADDAWHLVMAPRRTLDVLLVQEPESDRTAGVFLRQALAVAADPAPAVRVRRPGQLTAAELGAARLVILNDVPLARVPPAPVRAWVRNGGGLLVVLGGRSGASREEWSDLLPGAWADPVDRSDDRGGAVAWLDYTHPALAAFQAPRSGDFAAARFFRYRRVRPDSAAAVLARLDDGAPLLLDRAVGGGRVVLWSSAWDNLWSDFPVQPVFLPTVLELARYLAGVREDTPWVTVGQAADLRSLLTPPEAAELDVTGDAGAGALSAGRYFTPDRPGNLLVRARAGGWSAPLAANVDVSESDASSFEGRELVAAATVPADPALAPGAMLTPGERERRQSLWWYLVLGALLVLAAEGVLASRARHRVA